MLASVYSGDLPALSTPFSQATEACAQVGYNPLELSQATISNEPNGASGAILLNVAIKEPISPAPAPVRKVDAGLMAGMRSDSGALEPGAPTSCANPPAPSRVPSGFRTRTVFP